MSAELAMVASLKNDIRVFGSGTKEVVLEAGRDLVAGDEIAVGVDGKAYNRNVNVNIDQEPLSSVSIDGMYNNTSNGTFAVDYLPDGTPCVVRSMYNTSVSDSSKSSMVVVLPQADGTLYSKILHDVQSYQSGDTRYWNALISPEVNIIDDNHYMVTWIYNRRRYNSDGYHHWSYLKSVVITVSDDRESVSVKTSKDTTIVDKDGSTFGGYKGYCMSVGYSNNVIRVSGYNDGYYEYTITVDASDDYSIVHSSISTGMGTRSNDHRGFAITKVDADGNRFAIVSKYPTANEFWKIAPDGTETQLDDYSSEFSSPYYMSTFDDKVLFSYGTDSMFVYEFDDSANLTKVPIDTTNIGLHLDAAYMRDLGFVKVGDNDYLLCLPSMETNIVAIDNNSSSSWYMYNDSICRLTKKSDDSAYTLTKIGEMPKIRASSNSSSCVVSLPNGSAFIIGDSFDDFDEDNSRITTNTALYKMPDIDTGIPAAEYMGGNANTTVAEGDNVGVTVYGVLTGIDVPVGTKMNNLVGIGNAKSVKLGKGE